MAASERLLTRTASTCALEAAHGTHIFKIDGYNLYRAFGVGKSIESATFAVGGYDWRVRFYLDDHRRTTNIMCLSTSCSRPKA